MQKQNMQLCPTKSQYNHPSLSTRRKLGSLVTHWGTSYVIINVHIHVFYFLDKLATCKTFKIKASLALHVRIQRGAGGLDPQGKITKI